MKKVKCPKCGREILVDINENVLKEARESPSGVTALTFPHSDHMTIVYIDINGDIRGVQWALRITDSVVNMIKEIPIPAKKHPDPSKLSKEEWMFLAHCKEGKDLKEIASMMNTPYPKIRLLAEKLRAKGYLERIDIKF